MNSNSYRKTQWRRHFWIISVMLKFHKIVHNKKKIAVRFVSKYRVVWEFFKITI